MNCDREEVSLEDKLAEIQFELQMVESKILSLKERQEYLLRQKQSIKDEISLKKSLSLADRNWCSQEFPWSKKVNEILKSAFNLPSFRPFQLQTINAVLSKEDVILIMPTGGGKSLCYQLPALISPGIVLVVSPLVSLMEDQIFALKSLNISATMISASATREEVGAIQQCMVDKSAALKLLYVTPEKLAKSKRFMTKLQKMYEMKRLTMLAVDEVHCCSQWGHDFRPDYKFLGVLKGMFPDIPLLGLTATATSQVIVDVQKMLNVPGCLVFRASFNRPNLYYEVRQKPSNQKECCDSLVHLLKTRYAGQSGIIYTTSIKDCEELMEELRKRDIRIACYHANLHASLRSKVHKKWLTGVYQVVVATIAFGMGIDKPDVRFVLHHSLSKSMENFYQESGRAGRDNNPADCILFYRFADVFRLSTMVFTQQTGLENLYGIIAYCLDKTKCRRSIISTHFNENWKITDCNKMCDHCRAPREPKEVDISEYCRSLYKIIQQASENDVKLTAQMLIDSWLGKGKTNLRVAKLKVPAISRETAEEVLGHLLIEGYLAEDFHFTPYSTISYIKRGPRAATVLSDEGRVKIILARPRASGRVNDTPKSSLAVMSAAASTSKGSVEKSIHGRASNQNKNDSLCVKETNCGSLKLCSRSPSNNSTELSNLQTHGADGKDFKVIDSNQTVVDLTDGNEFVPFKKKKKVIILSDKDS